MDLDAYASPPAIVIARLREENAVVIAERTFRSTRRDCGEINAVFCDVCEMRRGEIVRPTSYLMDAS